MLSYSLMRFLTNITQLEYYLTTLLILKVNIAQRTHPKIE